MIIKYDILFVFVILEQKQKQSYLSFSTFKPFSVWKRFWREKKTLQSEIVISFLHSFILEEVVNCIVWTIDR